MPDFVHNDGGRAEAGYKGDTGDCVTRSIAIATGKPYKEVYDGLFELARTNRKYMAKLELRYGANARNHISPRNGMPREVYEPYLQSLGWHWVPTMHIGQGCTVHLRADELPSGNLVVRASKHMTAVIDGVIHDTYDPSREGTRCVYGYFTSTPPTPVVQVPARFHLSLRGESGHTHFEGDGWHYTDVMAVILSDLLGYKPEYIERTVLKKIRPGQKQTLTYGVSPIRFVITRD